MNRFKSIIYIVSIIVITGTLMSLNYETSSNPDWVLLGKKKVDLIADHDELIVGIKDGVFTKVKFKVVQAPIYIKNINIVFRNGDNKNLIIKRKFKKGTESKVFDLPGNKRIINKIKFNFKTAKNESKKSILIAFGKH